MNLDSLEAVQAAEEAARRQVLHSEREMRTAHQRNRSDRDAWKNRYLRALEVERALGYLRAAMVETSGRVPLI